MTSSVGVNGKILDNLDVWGKAFVLTCLVSFISAAYYADQKREKFKVTCTDNTSSAVVFNGLAKKNYKLNGSYHIHAVNENQDITVHKFNKNQTSCKSFEPRLR